MTRFAPISTAAAAAAIIISWPQMATAEAPSGLASWYLPAAINDLNTEVTFEVDSTWHTIHGKTSGVSGRLWLEDPTDSNSIRGSVEIPVKSFDTDSESRDNRLREVMKETEFSAVKFTITSIDGLCAPDSSLAADCSATASGTISIAGHDEIVAPALKIRREKDGIVVMGNTTFSWKLFPIEDPSILIARLDQEVSIKFSVKLGFPPRQSESSIAEKEVK